MAQNHESLHEAARYRGRLAEAGHNAGMDVESLDMTDAPTADQVLAVQRAAYRFEADLIGSDEIPPLHESRDDVMASPLDWLGVIEDGKIVGVLGYSVAGDSIDVDRLVVAPEMARMGIGSALLGALPPSVEVTVSTGTLNSPARAFYESHGFAAVGTSEPVPGLSVTHYLKEPR